MNTQRGSSTTVISISIGVLVLVGLIYWFMSQDATPETQQEEVLEELTEELEDLPEASVPNADPLQDVKVSKNPIETTNPFDDEYENPFNF